MTTKKKLEAFCYDEHDDAQFIQKYEENLEFFNGLLRTGSWEDLELVLHIKLLKYADPLNHVGRFPEALRVLNEVEDDLKKLYGRSNWYDKYKENLNFLKAVCLSRTKRYSESNQYFLKLLAKDQVDDNYLKWYRSNMKHLVNRLSWQVMIGCVIVYLGLLGLEWINPELNWPWMNLSVLTVGLLTLVSPYVMAYLIDRSKMVRSVARQ